MDIEANNPCSVSESGEHRWLEPEEDTGLIICEECGARTHAREEEVIEAVDAILEENEQDGPQSNNFGEDKLGPGLVLVELADVMEQVYKVVELGADKYGVNNWAKDIGTEHAPVFLKNNDKSILRHYFDSNTEDEESHCHPLAHAIVRMMYRMAYKIRAEK